MIVFVLVEVGIVNQYDPLRNHRLDPCLESNYKFFWEKSQSKLGVFSVASATVDGGRADDSIDSGLKKDHRKSNDKGLYDDGCVISYLFRDHITKGNGCKS